MAAAVPAQDSVNDLHVDKAALDVYVKQQGVSGAVDEVVQALLAARPADPRRWLLEHLESELSTQSQEISESELHRLFTATRKITSEIVPRDAIESVIRETITLLHCDRVSLFVVDKKMSMLRLYASNLSTPIMVPLGHGIVGRVFDTKDKVNIPDCYSCPWFDKSFDLQTGYVTRSVLAVPILDFENVPVGVIQAINKMPDNSPNEGTEGLPVGARAVPFGHNDEKILGHLTQHVSVAMRNSEIYREAISTSERSHGLLNTIQSLSQDLGTQSMLFTITMHANKIVSCERATVFLVDDATQQLWSVSTDTGQEIRIPKKAGIAGQCCAKAQVINIPDAYADSRFNQEVDKKTGFKTQSILAIPMLEDDEARKEMEAAAQRRKSLSALDFNVRRDRGDSVIGVIQMINKVSFDGQLEIFDESDMDVMELFAKFVGPKLAMSTMLARRSSESVQQREAEVALGKPAPLDAPGEKKRRSSCHKRASCPSLMAMAEAAADEEDDREGKIWPKTPTLRGV